MIIFSFEKDIETSQSSEAFPFWFSPDFSIPLLSTQVTFKHTLSSLKEKKNPTYAEGFECYKVNLHDRIYFVCLPSCTGTMDEPIWNILENWDNK